MKRKSNRPSIPAVMYDPEAFERYRKSAENDPYYRQAIGMAKTYDNFLEYYRNPHYTVAIEYQFQKAFYKQQGLDIVHHLDETSRSLQEMVSLALHSTGRFYPPPTSREINKYTYHISQALREGEGRVEDNLAKMVAMKDRKISIIRSISTDPNKVKHLLPVIMKMQKYEREFADYVREAVHSSIGSCHLMKSQQEGSGWVRMLSEQRQPESPEPGGYVM